MTSHSRDASSESGGVGRPCTSLVIASGYCERSGGDLDLRLIPTGDACVSFSAGGDESVQEARLRKPEGLATKPAFAPLFAFGWLTTATLGRGGRDRGGRSGVLDLCGDFASTGARSLRLGLGGGGSDFSAVGKLSLFDFAILGKGCCRCWDVRVRIRCSESPRPNVCIALAPDFDPIEISDRPPIHARRPIHSD